MNYKQKACVLIAVLKLVGETVNAQACIQRSYQGIGVNFMLSYFLLQFWAKLGDMLLFKVCCFLGERKYMCCLVIRSALKVSSRRKVAHSLVGI